MKKKARKIFFIILIVIWVFFLGVLLFVKEEKITTSVFFILNFTSLSLLLFHKYFNYPYSNYLEKKDTSKPTFRVACSSAIDVPKGFDFFQFKDEVGKKWLITYSDDIDYILKFRTRPHFFKMNSSIAAAWLKFDADTRKIHLECFPLGGIQHDSYAKKIQKEIEQSLLLYESV